MPIRIKKINVRELGPISQFSQQLADVNLIYGRNERGKTYLVEFMIRSLFKSPKLWSLRQQSGKGKVVVEGIIDNGLTDFSPASDKKLEDFWEESNTGLPADFSKLLVVKGAEVELAGVKGGIDKAILKRFLSSREILDKIENNISKTIQESQLENNTLTGPKRGEIQSRNELYEKVKRIDELFQQLDTSYSGGVRKQLQEQKQKLEEQIQQQVTAKQNFAFTLHKEMEALLAEKNKIDIDKIQDAKGKLSLYRQKLVDYREKEKNLQEAEIRSKNYEWLKSAQAVYENILQRSVPAPKPIFLILAILFLISAAVMAFLNLPLFAVAALAAVLGFGWLHLRKVQEQADQTAQNVELDRLKTEFYQHFHTSLTGLPLLLEFRENMEEDYNSARLLKKQLADDLRDLYTLKLEISDLINSVTGEKSDPKLWGEILRKVENEVEKLQQSIREKELFLAKLDVDPSDYKSEKSPVEYSLLKLESLENTLSEVELKIEQETTKLSSLKQVVCEHTNDDISAGWETIMDHLREKGEKSREAYRQKTAEILGKQAVYHVISQLREEEDSKIIKGLNAKEVQETVCQITDHYTSLGLDGDRLVVGDAYHNFFLDEISTGAQEQVLLALRIGFSKMLLGREHLFLILDDAFQYSDWQRRKLLVDKVADLAREGWQIIYFTMDDNIRELFDQKGQMFGDSYKSFQLSAVSEQL